MAAVNAAVALRLCASLLHPKTARSPDSLPTAIFTPQMISNDIPFPDAKGYRALSPEHLPIITITKHNPLPNGAHLNVSLRFSTRGGAPHWLESSTTLHLERLSPTETPPYRF